METRKLKAANTISWWIHWVICCRLSSRLPMSVMLLGQKSFCRVGRDTSRCDYSNFGQIKATKATLPLGYMINSRLTLRLLLPNQVKLVLLFSLTLGG